MERRGAKLAVLVAVLACALAALLLVVGVGAIGDSESASDDDLARPDAITGTVGDPDTSSGDRRALEDGDGDGNPYHETLPCTGPEEPANFEVFSAGSEVAGLPLTGTSRRCDTGVPAHGWPNNYVNYSYGSCEIPENATGCALPLTIQTWPACQRSKAEYTFEGKPLPYRKLPNHGGAEVVEFDFDGRVEVYTKSATIVIFARDQDLAKKAIGLLRPQDKGKPPATDADALRGTPPEGLAPPSDGSMEGVLPCQS